MLTNSLPIVYVRQEYPISKQFLILYETKLMLLKILGISKYQVEIKVEIALNNTDGF